MVDQYGTLSGPNVTIVPGTRSQCDKNVSGTKDFIAKIENIKNTNLQ